MEHVEQELTSIQLLLPLARRFATQLCWRAALRCISITPDDWLHSQMHLVHHHAWGCWFPMWLRLHARR